MSRYSARDGWHQLVGRDVYLEGGYVIRGRKTGSDGSLKTTHPFIWDRSARAWRNVSGELTPEQLARRMERGNAEML